MEEKVKHYITIDSGTRVNYPSGMNRDTQEGKTDYTLVDIAMLDRWAALMTRGAKKYGRRNWEKANSEEELDRFIASAFRHFVQWFKLSLDIEHDNEDHAAAVFFNIAAAERLKLMLNSDKENIDVDNVHV
jgi:hypothetical protein